MLVYVEAATIMKKEKHTCVLIIIESQVKVSHVVNISPLSRFAEFSLLFHLGAFTSCWFDFFSAQKENTQQRFDIIQRNYYKRGRRIFVMDCF